MTLCTSCGYNVTGKKFCSRCGTPVQPVASSASVATCPRCNGKVEPDAAFCMHCGSSLRPQEAPQPATLPCPACHAMVPSQSAFCTNCGHNMNEPVPSYQQPPSQYPQQPQYPQPQYPQYQQAQYPPPQYAQGGYQPQPMMGQSPMVLRCPTCMAMSPVGTAYCPGCRTNLAGVVPVAANMPAQGQQGGFLQGNGGNMMMGALGGAAAVIGGEMLLHGVENAVEGGRDYGGYGYRHRRRGSGGLLGGVGELADDIGL